jgi:hypothetical protein
LRGAASTGWINAAAAITAAAAKICLSITSSHKYEGRPAHIRWMDNCGVSHSFGDRRVPRAFVMQDEALFISCDKKAGGLAHAGFNAD